MKNFKLTDEEFAEIVAINKEGGDPVMYLSGGTPMGRSLAEKVNFYWEGLGRKRGFDPTTVQAGSSDKYFSAEEVEKEVEKEILKSIDIRFAGPPDQEGGRFVEVENSDTGAGIAIGEWIDRKDGYWVLRIPLQSGAERIKELESLLAEIKKTHQYYSDHDKDIIDKITALEE